MTNAPLTPADRPPEEPETAAQAEAHPAAEAPPRQAEEPTAPINEGPAAAALLAAGVGGFTLGLLTTLAEASTGIKDALAFTEDVGPLSGKTTYAVIVWLIAWLVLHLAIGRRARLSATVLTITVVLVALGLLGTFPIFFQLFAAE